MSTPLWHLTFRDWYYRRHPETPVRKEALPEVQVALMEGQKSCHLFSPLHLIALGFFNVQHPSFLWEDLRQKEYSAPHFAGRLIPSVCVHAALSGQDPSGALVRGMAHFWMLMELSMTSAWPRHRATSSWLCPGATLGPQRYCKSKSEVLTAPSGLGFC